MNNYQKLILEKFGDDVICIEDTHGMNLYNFNLTTILILDDMREGFPCVFMINNRVDEAVLKILFSQIRALIGQIEPICLIWPIVFFDACLVEMRQPTFRLYCTWHIDQAWRKIF